MTTITARRLLLDDAFLESAQLVIEGQRILEVRQLKNAPSSFDVDILSPSYIDTHTHGGAGFDVMDEDEKALREIALHKAREGVGAFLATTSTASLENTKKTLLRIAKYMKTQANDAATVLGTYLEGPYFTPQHKGAHEASLFRELDLAELDDLLEASDSSIKVLALAPEKQNSKEAIEYLRSRGVLVMLGHSAADYDCGCKALDAGANGLVHCYNAMNALHHRSPGLLGACLTDKRAFIELIADALHVHPAMMKIAAKMAKERLLLITDSMRAAGMEDGEYEICGFAVWLKEGAVRLKSGNLAGSALRLDEAVKNMVNLVGLSQVEALNAASSKPAHFLGLKDLGLLKAGYLANVLALDEGLNMKKLWIKGRRFF